MGLKRRSVLLALLAVGCMSLAPQLSEGQAPLSERQVKAAFLFNFVKFVTWPADSFRGPDAPLTVCVLGNEPLGDDLQRLLTGATANNRPLKMERVEQSQDLSRCHVVFFGADHTHPRELLATIAASPILTVGEAEQFGRWGGIITFVMEDDRVRFEINQEAAGRAGLKISSKLLSLARSVTVGKGGR